MSTFTGLGGTALLEGQGGKEATINNSFSALAENIGGILSKSVAGSVDVTLTTSEENHRIVEFTGAITANINIVISTSSRVFHCINSTSGAFTLTVKTAAGTGVSLTQGFGYMLYNDGVNVYSVVLSTGGVAPLSYTVGTVPVPSTPGVIIYVTDEIDGAVLCFSDGVAWRRIVDRVVINSANTVAGGWHGVFLVRPPRTRRPARGYARFITSMGVLS